MAYHGLNTFPQLIAKRAVTQKRHHLSFFTTLSPTDPLHICGIDAEPLHRYKSGGYHPIGLRHLLKDGRYKVLHKLGWGGYSTVWAARDQRDEIYVAVKVCVAELEEDVVNRELQVMKETASIQPRSLHIIRMLDEFNLEGPNGTHKCLVLELLGPSVPDIVKRYSDGRLPGKLARVVAKQALFGLDVLHQRRIGHGDLHIRNLAFALPYMDRMSEEEFVNMLGKPELGHVQRRDDKPIEARIPKYLVRPASNQRPSLLSHHIKIIDFGQSFLSTIIPQTLHTPLSVRAPEVIFEDRLDYRVDLWSMGCMIFELFTGQPPFDSTMVTQSLIAREMQETVSDALPERWQSSWNAMKAISFADGPGFTLEGWLEEVYLDNGKKPDLTAEDVARLGGVIGRMLRFEPSVRASTREILDDPWFRE